jgi:hypothetical protein
MVLGTLLQPFVTVDSFKVPNITVLVYCKQLNVYTLPSGVVIDALFL